MKLIYLAPVAFLAATTMAQANSKSCKTPFSELTDDERKEYKKTPKKDRSKFLKKVCQKRQAQGGKGDDDKNDNSEFMQMAEQFMKETDARFSVMNRMMGGFGDMMKKMDERVQRLEGAMKKMMYYMNDMEDKDEDSDYDEDDKDMEIMYKIMEIIKNADNEEDAKKNVFEFIKRETEMSMAEVDPAMHDMMIEHMIMKGVEHKTKMMAHDPDNKDAEFFGNCLKAHYEVEEKHENFDHGEMTAEQTMQHVKDDYQKNYPDCYDAMMAIYNGIHNDVLSMAENYYQEDMNAEKDVDEANRMKDCYAVHENIKKNFGDDKEAGYEAWKMDHPACAAEFDGYWWDAFLKYKTHMAIEMASMMMDKKDGYGKDDEKDHEYEKEDKDDYEKDTMPEGDDEEEKDMENHDDKKHTGEGKYGYGY